MTDRIVVLRPDEPQQFLVDACAALAELVNEPHAWSPLDEELLAVYAESVAALATLRIAELEGIPAASDVAIAIIDHLLGRLHEAKTREIGIPLADIVDRLHAEVVSDFVSP